MSEHQKVKAFCEAVVTETEDAKTFKLRLQDEVKFNFAAGQYALLDMEIDGQQVSRNYTISSKPDDGTHLEFTVKRVEGGLVSNWLIDHFAKDHTLELSGPFGDFVHQANDSRELVFFACGSGITPFLSVIRSMQHLNDVPAVTLFYSAKTADSFICKKELETLRQQHDWLTIHYFCSQQSTGIEPPFYSGRITGDLVKEFLLHQSENTHYMMCGPNEYMENVAQWLEQLNVDSKQISRESFGVMAPVDSDNNPNQEAGKSFDIRTEDGISFSCNSNETILDAALRQDIKLNYACKSGICGFCVAKKVSGDVHERPVPVDSTDGDPNKILCCSSEPLSDILLSLEA